MRFLKQTYPIDNSFFNDWIKGELQNCRIKTDELEASISSDVVTIDPAVDEFENSIYKEFSFPNPPGVLGSGDSGQLQLLADFFPANFSLSTTGFDLLKRIQKRCVWFVGGDQTTRKRIPLWGLDFVQPRFFKATQRVINDITFNESAPTAYDFYGYGYGTVNGSYLVNNLLINVPMVNIGNKFIPLSVQKEQQDGYCFYFDVRHDFGGDVFSIRAIRVSVMAGNIQISRNAFGG
jgi:hypothetical protein